MAPATSAAAPSDAIATDVSAEAARYAALQQFGDDVAARRNLDAHWVQLMLSRASFLPEIRPLMVPPTAPGAKNWRAYRKRFVSSSRIRAGVRFWQDNREALARAQAEFGVPPEIIVAILGVETVYGRNTGDFRVLDTLSTLAFDFPRAHPRAAAREAFFRSELEQFLTLFARTGMNPLAARGSYAGAMGMPQFMPSSWRHYAVDFDGDGHIDLWHSNADVIGSVAHYFKSHGWIAGQPTHYGVVLAPDADLPALLAPDITPTFTPDEFARLGATVSTGTGINNASPLALIELRNGNPALPGHAPEYVAGTENFYVVTRYNHSAFYAMAVIDLGQEISQALGD